MRTMYDAVDPADIPAGGDLVAGYLDGPLSKWPDAAWGKFAGKIRVGIAVFASTNDGHVLDIENGDATPAEAPGWVLRRRAAGADPSVYCGMSAWGEVRAAFQSGNIPEPHYWIADPTGQPHIPPGAVACQWGFKGSYDVSSVMDYWPGVDNGQTWGDPVNPSPATPPAVPTEPAQDPAPAPPAPVPPPLPAPDPVNVELAKGHLRQALQLLGG